MVVVMLGAGGAGEATAAPRRSASCSRAVLEGEVRAGQEFRKEFEGGLVSCWSRLLRDGWRACCRHEGTGRLWIMRG